MYDKGKLLVFLACVVGGILLVASLLAVLSRSRSQESVIVVTPTLSVSPTNEISASLPVQAAAIVNGEIISWQEWRRMVALDEVMNTLARQPSPGAEATLQRMINLRLVLRAAGAQASPPEIGLQQAQARLESLQRQWGVDDAQLGATLEQAGLQRADLLESLQQLLVADTFLSQQAGGQAEPWLQAQIEQARISISSDLSALEATPPGEGEMLTEPALTLVARTDTQPAAAPGVNEGQLAPEVELPVAGGETIRLSDYRGAPVLLHFWASWCPVCRQELPTVETFYQQHRALGVHVLGINLREEQSQVIQFGADNQLSFPLLLDSNAAISQRFQVVGIPTSVLVDANGVIHKRQVGPLDVALFGGLLQPLLEQENTKPPLLSVAQLAPDFSLPRPDGNLVSLRDYRDKQTVVLVFYSGST